MPLCAFMKLCDSFEVFYVFVVLSLSSFACFFPHHSFPLCIDVPSFRYSAGNVGLSGIPMTHVDGLCPHHEKALAEQYVANQLAGLQFEGKSW